MSSRLERSASGRAVRAVVTAPDVGLPVGASFVVLGDALFCAEPGFYFTGTRTPPVPPVEVPRRRRAVGARPAPRVWSAEVKSRALDLVAGGMTWSMAAKEIDAPKSTVGLWVRQAAVAGSGDELQTTPGPHQQRI